MYIAEPGVGHTETFISIGAFDTRLEAESAEKYLKTKFARTMLGIWKVTQNGPISTYREIPVQNFAQNSDIDWKAWQLYSITTKEVEKYAKNILI